MLVAFACRAGTWCRTELCRRNIRRPRVGLDFELHRLARFPCLRILSSCLVCSGCQGRAHRPVGMAHDTLFQGR